MNVAEFSECLRQTGCYSTKGGIRKYHFPSFIATPLFQLFLAEIFVRGSIRAVMRTDFMNTEWAAFGFRVLQLVERMRGHITISGFENKNSYNGPVVWVVNHVSSLETYLLPSILMTWPGLIVVLKESLAHYPIFGHVVRAVSPIRVLRKNPMDDLRKVLTEGVEGIKQGRSALIFPQGKRERQFDPSTFNSLGTKLAKKAGVPVIPVAVSTDFLRIGKLHRDLFMTVHPESPVRIACGPVIPHTLSPADIQSQAIYFITSKLAEWQNESGLKLLASPQTSAAMPHVK